VLEYPEYVYSQAARCGRNDFSESLPKFLNEVPVCGKKEILV